MSRWVAQDSAVEVIIYVVLAVIWVVIQAASRASRSGRSSSESGPPPIRRTPPVLEPDEELRRFLEELRGGAETAPAPPEPSGTLPGMPAAPPKPPATSPEAAPPIPRPIPSGPPPMPPRRTGAKEAPRMRPPRARPHAVAVAAPGTPSSRQPAMTASASLAKEAAIREMAPLDWGTLGVHRWGASRHSLLPDLSPSFPRTPRVGALAVLGGAIEREPQVRLGSRQALRDAIIYATVLGPPRALEPYRPTALGCYL